MQIQGQPIRGHVSSTDASTALTLALFNPGDNTPRTLQPDEYIEIHQIELVAAGGGDCQVFFSDDNTLDTGETILRGTFGANGGIEKQLTPPRAGGIGKDVRVIAPAGQIDVNFMGTIRNGGDSTGVRPSWKADVK